MGIDRMSARVAVAPRVVRSYSDVTLGGMTMDGRGRPQSPVAVLPDALESQPLFAPGIVREMASRRAL